MERHFDVEDTDYYYTDWDAVPSHPSHGCLCAEVDDENEYIKVFIFDGDDKQWYDVTRMENLVEEKCVRVSYNTEDEAPEDIEMMDYNYRLGIG